LLIILVFAAILNYYDAMFSIQNVIKDLPLKYQERNPFIKNV